MSTQANRQVIPLADGFFNDGAWYVLTSTSLGGSHLSPEQLVNKLQSDNAETLLDLARNGICLPLFFQADCELDNAVIILGDLTEQEQHEWVGRIQAELNIPCGEFLLLGGGGCEDDWEIALEHENPPDPQFMFFQKVKLPAGRYLLEIYAFLSSVTGSYAWENLKKRNTLPEQWRQSPTDFPDWLEQFIEQEYIDSSEFDLQDYLLRLTPLQQQPPLPTLVPEVNWFGEFEIRMPETAPTGISRSALLR